MIRYQLRCSRGHGFEGWFRNSDAYADEVRHLTCPLCDDPTIEKAIMAPAVQLRSDKAGAADETPPSVVQCFLDLDFGLYRRSLVHHRFPPY